MDCPGLGTTVSLTFSRDSKENLDVCAAGVWVYSLCLWYFLLQGKWKICYDFFVTWFYTYEETLEKEACLISEVTGLKLKSFFFFLPAGVVFKKALSVVVNLGVLNTAWPFAALPGRVTCGDFLAGVLVSEHLCSLSLVAAENLNAIVERKMSCLYKSNCS